MPTRPENDLTDTLVCCETRPDVNQAKPEAIAPSDTDYSEKSFWGGVLGGRFGTSVLNWAIPRMELDHRTGLANKPANKGHITDPWSDNIGSLIELNSLFFL